MREDMAKVIVERPRLGHRHPEPGPRRRKRERHELEEAPRHEGMKGRSSSKWLNENLAPLRRFLEGSVGRPWSKVHAELCARIAPSSAVQKHVLDHARDFVATDVELRGDEVWGTTRCGGYCRLDGRGGRRLYVHPVTGLVVEVRRKKRSRLDGQCICRDRRSYRRIDGIWYEVVFARVPEDPEARARCRDVVLDELLLWRWQKRLRHVHGFDDRYAVRLRVLDHRERVLVTQGGPAIVG